VPAPRPTPAQAVSLADLAARCAGRLDPSAGDVLVHGVTLDSRSVQPEDLYAALPGARFHGASFAADAAAAGAAAILTDPAGAQQVVDAAVAVPTLVVDDPRAVLGALSSAIYGTGRLPLTLYGITGTNGKTTTAYLIVSALSALGQDCGLIGTVETRIGKERIDSVRTTPEAPDLHGLLAVMAERGLDSCVMEVSSHALALHRVDGVRYDLALFTNLSQDHLDFHADMDDYFAAKAELFTPLRSDRGLVCIDDEWGRRLALQADVPIHTIATDADAGADWVIKRADEDPSAFTLRGPDAELHLRSLLPGDFNITNTAMAAVALLLTGFDAADVERAVLTDPHVPGRMEPIPTDPANPDAPLAVVDYAHTPDAVEAALAALRPTTSGRLVVVLGAGGDRDRGKRAAMGAAAVHHADVVVVTDDNPRSEDPAQIRAAILEGARAAAAQAPRAVTILEVGDRRDAIARAVAEATTPDSAVAVVGKGHETGQEIAGVVHPFDDRAELRAALAGHHEGDGR
jgi:UDP-N-acetylmuramoyl-L-alanyl-D-glutamate--2,6-diaminopimelate ligase